MNFLEKYFNKLEEYNKFIENATRVSIDDNWQDQKIEYKNRLISSPFKIGTDASDFFDYGDLPVPSGPCPFKGKSNSEKYAMCKCFKGMKPNEALAAGLIIDIEVKNSRGTQRIKFNKYAANDLMAICKEISSLGWFNFSIGSAFRTNPSAGGRSLHQCGVAVDINPGAANPWFAHRCTRSEPEPTTGSTPWPPNKAKGWSTPGCPYDRTKCTWHYGHPVVKIFENHGWGWGGSYGDVMHFSITGN